MAELAAPQRHSAAAQEAPKPRELRRSATDSLLDALRWVDIHSGSSRGDLELPRGPSAARQGGQQQQQSGHVQEQGDAGDSDQQQQRWWLRLPGQRRGVESQRDLAGAGAGKAATLLRRTQSASEPLQRGDLQDSAVPIRMRQRQQPNDSPGDSSAAAGGSARGAASSSSRSSAAAGSSSTAPHEVLPYRLQAVGHSLGAACLMMYAVVCRMRGEPHRLRRLILMSPAGFHPTVPLVRGWVWGWTYG